MPKLTVEGMGEFDIPQGKRLVLALEDEAKVDQLHACGGNARCTTCRVEFVSGEPEQMTQAEKAVLAARGLTGVRLSCQILGGLDVLLAAVKVGPAGRAIGIDMTPEMIERARRNAERQGIRNVDFHLSTIDKLPSPDASVDCVISNCVINLAPDKRDVFREVFRVLKPGGRLAVSDIALKKPLPADLAASVAAYVGCIAGAITIEEYRRSLEEAGFAAVQVV